MTGGREESSQYTVDSTQGRRRTADNSEFRRARSARVASDQAPVSSSGAGVGAVENKSEDGGMKTEEVSGRSEE